MNFLDQPYTNAYTLAVYTHLYTHLYTVDFCISIYKSLILYVTYH